MLGSLFSEVCPGCAGRAAAGFCAACSAELARVAAPCRACGLAQPAARCPRRAVAWRVDAVVAPFAYAAPLDGYVHALKYRGARNLGRALGLLLAAAVRGARRRRARAGAAASAAPARARLQPGVEIARTLGARARAAAAARAASSAAARTRRRPVSAAAERLRNVAAAFAVAPQRRGHRGSRSSTT